MTLLFIQNMGGASIILFMLLSIAYFILWVYCLIDVIRSNFKDSNMKLIWILVLLFAQVIGPIAYLIMGQGTKTS
jgi:hypothetical protein